MKKILTTIFLLVVTVSFAQLKVKDVEKNELIGEYNLLGKPYVTLEKNDNLCVLRYRDEKFDKIDNYKFFIFKYSDLDALYDLLTNFEGVEKGTHKTVELENGDVLDLEYKKTLGKMYIAIYHTNKAGVMGKLRYLTPAQFKKVFGKE
ncbi:hypothetical protein [Flavobacterium rhizosphaerae]|uniref:DUF4252 domain-containing protein n=1 Tax=Flavobacterium rhizosphaerae TaxID=3163298 RepID=A0ABW8Z1J6_9FLAO